MSGVLESLTNPLSALATTPRSLQLAVNTATGESVWDPLQQYYANDACFSSVNGGLYVYAPLVTDPSFVRGGSDPATAGAPWTSASTVGVSPGGWVQPTAAPTFVAGAAGAPITVTNGTVTVPPNSKWLSLFTCTVANASAWVAADNVGFTFTGNGTGTNTAVTTPCYGGVGGPASVSFSSQCVVSVGTGGLSIVLTATTTGSAGVLTPSNANWTLLRLE
jgi:hypothetical protein